MAKKLTIDKILSYPTNVVNLLDKDLLEGILDYCSGRYQDLKATRSPRNEQLRKANEEALQIYKPKTFPWKGAASVKYPLITNACIDFASRIFPAVWQDGDVAKTKYYQDNKDFQAGDRIAKYLNYYIAEKVPGWQENLDKLTTALPVDGVMMKKVYFDPEIMAVRSDLVFPQDLFVPCEASTLEDAEFFFHRYTRTRREVIGYLRSGLWSNATEEDFAEQNNEYDSSATDATVREEDRQPTPTAGVFEIVEGYVFQDLDGDGYSEPYIVTFCPAVEKVLRIVPRFDETSLSVNEKGQIYKIVPDQYFVTYCFMQSPDGGFYALGFGDLLLPMNQAINTTINQLLDAGTLNNTSTGWISKSMRLEQGENSRAPGKWRMVNTFVGKLSDNILPEPKVEPSATTFELMKLLIDAGNSIAGAQQIKDIQIPSNLSATSSMAIIENGMTGLKSVYKRFHYSLGQELRLILKWVSKYPDIADYQNIVNGSITDFNYIGSIVPVSDPNLITTISKATKAQQIQEMATQGLIPGGAAAIQICDFAGIDPTTVIPQEMSPIEKINLQKAAAELDFLKAQTMQALALALRAKDQGIGDLYRADTEGTARAAAALSDLKNATTFKRSRVVGDKVISEDVVDTQNLATQIKQLADAVGISFATPIGRLLGDKLKQSIPEGVEGVEDVQPNDVSSAMDSQINGPNTGL